MDSFQPKSEIRNLLDSHFNRRILSVITGVVIGIPIFFWVYQFVSLPSFVLIILFLLLCLVFGLIIDLFIFPFVFLRFAGHTRLWQTAWLIGVLLAGLWLTLNIPIPYPGLSKLSGLTWIYKLLYTGSAGVGIGLVLLAFITVLASYTGLMTTNHTAKRFHGYLYALPMLIIWGVYLLAFWPGMMSADSMDQWGQVLTGQFNDHHPIFHTLTLWLLTRISLSPAIIAMAQILFLGSLAGLILNYFESLGTPQPLIWLASFLFALSPVNGTMVVTLWKDIPYSIAVLWLTFTIYKFIESSGEWINDPRNWLLLGLNGALVSLFRYEGLLVVFGTFVLGLAVFIKQWKHLLLAFIIFVCLYLGVQGSLYKFIRITRSTDLVIGTTSLYRIASETDARSQNDTLLLSIRPFSNDWNCKIASKIGKQWQAEKPATMTTQHKFINLFRYIPNLVMFDYRCMRSVGWVIWDQNGAIYNTSHVQLLMDPNPYGLKPDSKIPWLRNTISTFVTTTSADSNFNWFIWRPALFMYTFILMMAVLAFRKREARFLFVATPILLQAVTFSIILVNPNFRYHYSVYLVSLLFWPVLFSRLEKHGKSLSNQG